MFNKLGSKPTPAEPPPPYSGPENPENEMTAPKEDIPLEEKLAEKPIVDYNDTHDADLTPPTPHTVA